MNLALEITAVVLALLFLLRVLNLAVLYRWYQVPKPPGGTINLEERRVYYSLKGEGNPVVVIESALGAVSPEWWRIQDALSPHARVLTYDRAGYGWSAPADEPRLGNTVAAELKELLDALQIDEPVVLVGHSIGGLYVNHFARLYPERVCGIVLIDPVSTENDRFRTELPAQVFRKSGVDKATGLKILTVFNGFGFSRLMKKWAMRSYALALGEPLPPQTLSVLWNHMLLPHTPKTALEEYFMIRGRGPRLELEASDGFPAVPLRVITHSPEVQIDQIVRFGGLPKEQAESVEKLWRELLQAHLALSPKSSLVVAERSSHNVHLDEPDLVVKNILDMIEVAGKSGSTAV